MGHDYVPIKLPKELVDLIDKLVGKYGFRSRAEVVKEAVRIFLREYGIYAETEER